MFLLSDDPFCDHFSGEYVLYITPFQKICIPEAPPFAFVSGAWDSPDALIMSFGGMNPHES
jgi:hypothetical protein